MSCALAHRSFCDGGLDPHHIIPQQRIRNHIGRGSWQAELAVRDDRNIILLCRKHHHEVTVGAIHLAETEIPGSVWAFATDWDLSWSLENDLVAA